MMINFFSINFFIISKKSFLSIAVVAQLVERQPSKLNVASSNLVRRSKAYTHSQMPL
jgi:hypothetical protein